jgi:DNA-binding transcriptional MerR regulator
MDEPATTGLTVAQMAAATGVSPHTLRYYEKAGLIEPVARNSGNQRRYSEADIEWLQFLLRLRETGMPIAQMREYAALRAKGPQTTAARLSLLEKHQARLHEQIVLVRGHENALAAKITSYRADLAAQRSSVDQTEGAEVDE